MTSSSLARATDADSANEVLPNLTEATDLISGVSKSLADAPAIPKAAIARVAGRDLGKIEAAAEKAMGMDGVGSILEPAIGPLMDALKSIAK